MTRAERNRERALPRSHDFTTLNGLDCLQCPLPEGNAVHVVPQLSLLVGLDTFPPPPGVSGRPPQQNRGAA